MRKRPKKATWYECPDCGEKYEDEEDAQLCHPKEVEEIKGYVCGECGLFHECKEDAKNCCIEDDD
jgi:transcription elongation factor Elf1